MNSTEKVLEASLTRKRQLERLQAISRNVLLQKKRWFMAPEPDEYHELVALLKASENTDWFQLGGATGPRMIIPNGGMSALDWLKGNWEGFWPGNAYAYAFVVVRHWYQWANGGRFWACETLWVAVSRTVPIEGFRP